MFMFIANLLHALKLGFIGNCCGVLQIFYAYFLSHENAKWCIRKSDGFRDRPIIILKMFLNP